MISLAYERIRLAGAILPEKQALGSGRLSDFTLDMALPPPAEGSAEVARRVAAARARQVARGVRSNAELEGERLEQYATPDEAGRKLLLQAAEKLRLSARGYTRMLRVARTIADLAGAETVGRVHVAEALSYRLMTG